MPRRLADARHVGQRSSGVFRDFRGASVQQFAAFDNEQQQQAIDDAQPLTVVLLRGQGAGLGVELDIGLSREGVVVAEDAQLQVVGQEGPELIVRAIEKRLDDGDYPSHG